VLGQPEVRREDGDMRNSVALGIAVIGVLLAAGTASAYPQFQLSRDQTCTGCHLSPAGGGLLNENGYNVAETISQYGTAPEFMYNKLSLPSWLILGGDFRGAAGYFNSGPDPLGLGVVAGQAEANAAAFALIPMQAELYVDVHYKGFSIRGDVGARPTQHGNEAATSVWSREHYVEWQSNPDGNDGFYIRVGRFMPVFGLRFVEHVDYNRMYGGVPLYGETYGAAVEYVSPKYEAHLTGYIKDPLIDPVMHTDGVALYAETRLGEHTALGIEGKIDYDSDNDLDTYRAGITAKQYFGGAADILLQAEIQAVTERVLNNGGRGAPAQGVGYLMASRFFGTAFMLDLGLGYYDENVRITGLDRDAIDLNLHWFTTSHFELILMNRISKAGLSGGAGGQVGAWSLLQAHYRL
jgi:hypothetical protein